MQLSPVEEDVGEEVRAAVEKTAGSVLLGVREQLEEVSPAPARLAISLDLDPEHVEAGPFPEQIHTSVAEARILLDVMDLRARGLLEEEATDERDGPVRRVLHGLH